MYFLYLLILCITANTAECAQELESKLCSRRRGHIAGHVNLMRICFETQIDSHEFTKLYRKLQRRRNTALIRTLIEHMIDAACRQPVDYASLTDTYHSMQRPLSETYLRLIDHKIAFDPSSGQRIIRPCITLKLDADVQEQALIERESLCKNYLNDYHITKDSH